MRRLLWLAGVLALTAAAASAQIQPIKPIGSLGSTKPLGSATTPPVDTFTPYTPPRRQSVYDNGPFSPQGEAERQRKQTMTPPGGPFSPDGEARRRKAQEKTLHPF